MGLRFKITAAGLGAGLRVNGCGIRMKGWVLGIELLQQCWLSMFLHTSDQNLVRRVTEHLWSVTLAHAAEISTSKGILSNQLL